MASDHHRFMGNACVPSKTTGEKLIGDFNKLNLPIRPCTHSDLLHIIYFLLKFILL